MFFMHNAWVGRRLQCCGGPSAHRSCVFFSCMCACLCVSLWVSWFAFSHTQNPLATRPLCCDWKAMEHRTNKQHSLCFHTDHWLFWLSDRGWQVSPRSCDDVCWLKQQVRSAVKHLVSCPWCCHIVKWSVQFLSALCALLWNAVTWKSKSVCRRKKG